MSVSGSLKMDVVKPVARIELDPSSLSFDEVGGTQTLTATLYDADDNEMQPTYWGWSSADREVAAVNGRFFSEGVSATVQAIGEGTTTVTLSANGTKESANVTVTITGRQVDISPASLTFTALGDTKSVTVRVLDENGVEDADATFSFIGTFSPCCGPDARNYLVLCSQSLFGFADLGDDGLCRGGPDKGCGVIVSAIDVVVDRLD